MVVVEISNSNMDWAELYIRAQEHPDEIKKKLIPTQR
jgi:hypothetical protein